MANRKRAESKVCPEHELQSLSSSSSSVVEQNQSEQFVCPPDSKLMPPAEKLVQSHLTIPDHLRTGADTFVESRGTYVEVYFSERNGGPLSSEGDSG